MRGLLNRLMERLGYVPASDLEELVEFLKGEQLVSRLCFREIWELTEPDHYFEIMDRIYHSTEKKVEEEV